MAEASTLRAAWRGAAFLALTLVLLAVYLVAGLVRGRRQVARLWCRSVCLLLGIAVQARGTAFAACPTVYVANHVSYLDVVVLGTLLDATFVAKSEVAGWPLFGMLGRVSGTFFVRRRRCDALIQRNALAARLRGGESFVLFAEGTSTDGRGVLPFKTSLLSVAEPWVLDRPVAVQPVTMAYRGAGGADARQHAWYGDDAFLSHLWRVLGLPGVEVAVELGEPVLSWSVASRKVLGAALQATVAEQLATLRQAALPAQTVACTEDDGMLGAIRR